MSITDYTVEFNKKMRELRCLKCRGLLMREYVYSGRIEIKCTHTDPGTSKKCGELNRFVFKDYQDNRKNKNAKIQSGSNTE